MATQIEQAAQLANAVEQLLTQSLESNAPDAEIAVLIEDFRVASERIIFSDFQYAEAHSIEARLWAAHTKISNRYRKRLGQLKRNNGKQHHIVENRKVAKAFLEFIKSSQRFYRQYILNLDARFDGIPELRKVAQMYSKNEPNVRSKQPLSPKLKHEILLSCHQTLIQLGDLSRYRETAALGDGKERKWGPAKGYYGLATEIYPDAGVSHNQQAVIAREDGDHFRTTYHLYRALSTKQGYPLAKANLELEFKKIRLAWEKGELISSRATRDGNGAGQALISWFVRLHSKCYKGEDFPEHEELENEVLSQLTIELKEQSLDGILQKIILINLAAEYFASLRVQEPNREESTIRSYFYFLRLNVKTFFTLLQLLQSELERLTDRDDVTAPNGDRPPQLSDKITVVARRVLPSLWLYSMWFTKFWRILNAHVADTLTKVEVQELWKAYAETLTLLMSVFPPEEVALLERVYLLDEDVHTIAFQPLAGDETKDNWYAKSTGRLKPRWSDPEVERHHPNEEMVIRVRDLLEAGLVLVEVEATPLELHGRRFVYQEAGLPSELLASPNNRPDGSPLLPAESMDMPLFTPEIPLQVDQVSHDIAPSESASTIITKDVAMNRMVDDLVGQDDGLDPLQEEDENIPPTPPEQTFEDTALVDDTSYGIGPLTVSDFVNAVQHYGKPLCSPQPPIFSTPMNRMSSSSSIIQPPAKLPSLPAQKYNDGGIWNPQYGSPGPASPTASGLAPRNSPFMSTDHFGHSRGNSVNSIRSSNAFQDWTGPTVTPNPLPHPAAYTNGLGNSFGNGAVLGNTNQAIYGNGQAVHQSVANINLMSSIFSGNRSTWSSDLERGTSSYGRTPPNGQGG
ncbi:uncharacterized protein BDZ99DRAFT_514701 [Mytilinidion resinicola]|uniref:Nonsense-mediated mRNA decay factor n=1 Tax=Mytilinidion resinicola TaxID=574789 RepID=A0A6A6Z4M9_9PEZI|nr:uncharacterized protein BDZ99DRAFT_514701 [Mytilinidion resinicola]KAF2816091.1 hypothetical protein BDZ99DRAFT_514701 [Mytilinidion resinicola]